MYYTEEPTDLRPTSAVRFHLKSKIMYLLFALVESGMQVECLLHTL